jgi:hypothetical protein
VRADVASTATQDIVSQQPMTKCRAVLRNIRINSGREFNSVTQMCDSNL